MNKFILIVISFLYIVTVSATQALTTEEWKSMEDKVQLLEGPTALLPSLLPFIMENKQPLQLTNEQVSSFREWRKKNYANMVNVMNEIIALKIQFRTESMLPEVSGEYLMDTQSRIHNLQHGLLAIRLSCRKLLMTTFTDEQWEDFAFIASDHPSYATLLIQNNSMYPYANYEEWLANKFSRITPAAGRKK